jgi:hypothetical protein
MKLPRCLVPFRKIIAEELEEQHGLVNFDKARPTRKMSTSQTMVHKKSPSELRLAIDQVTPSTKGETRMSMIDIQASNRLDPASILL